MPNVVLNGVYRLCVYCHDMEQGSVNTVHLGVSLVTGTAPSYQDVVNAYDTAIAPDMKPIMSNVSTYDGCSIQNAQPLPIYARVFSASNAGPGVGGSTALPRQTSGLISVYSVFAGRKNRGRFYMPFPSVSSNLNDGIPNAGYKTGLDNLAATLFTPRTITASVGGGTAVMIPLISNRQGTITVPILTTVSRTKWATQRRRGSYGRPNSSPI